MACQQEYNRCYSSVLLKGDVCECSGPASSGALQVRVNLCCDQLPQESRGHDSDLGEEFMAKKLFKV